jgi:carbon-monoxide dehydrogenase medium subunit
MTLEGNGNVATEPAVGPAFGGTVDTVLRSARIAPAPATLEEALALLASRPGAKALAGGQSLIPTMAFRLAAPSMLVDLRKVRELEKIRIDAEGARLGARVRWRDIQQSAELKRAQPLLVAAVEHVAHYQIRNRGTVGGSLAHADPAAELPGIAVTCDAQIQLQGRSGARVVKAGEFFTGPLSTVLADDELIVEVRFPAWPAERRWGFEEISPRRGDFAYAGVAAFFDIDDGKAANAHVGVIGACQRPHRIREAEAALNGRVVNAASIREAAAAAQKAVDPPGDLHASAAYRRSLVGTLLERALSKEA